MKNFLAKRWFLLLLVGGLGLGWWQPALLHPYTGRLPPLAVVAPALFLMALGLESQRLFRAVVRPLPALWAVVISYGALPALAWSTGPLLPDPDYHLGLMIITSAPCTLASAALWTRMAGGNEATALLGILLTTGTSWLATTAWLVGSTGVRVGTEATGMMRELFLVLVPPVAAGQLLRAFGPVARAATRHKAGLGVASRLLILVMILKAAVDFREKLGERLGELGAGLLTTGMVCMGVHLLALGAGFWSSRLLGIDRPGQIAVAFAGSQKTLPVALLLFETYFPHAPLALVPVVFYHGGQLIADTFIADQWAAAGHEKPQLPDEGLV